MTSALFLADVEPEHRYAGNGTGPMRTMRFVNHERACGIAVGTLDEFAAQNVEMFTIFVVAIDGRPFGVRLHFNVPDAGGATGADSFARDAWRNIANLQGADINAVSRLVSLHMGRKTSRAKRLLDHKGESQRSQVQVGVNDPQRQAPNADDAVALLNTVRGGKRGALDATDALESFASAERLAREHHLLPAAAYTGGAEARKVSAFKTLVQLRTALQAFLVARGEPGKRKALLECVNGALASGRAHMKLAYAARESWYTRPDYAAGDPYNVVYAFGLAVVDLLQNTPLESVKRCEAANCIWFFIDTTKNQSRRWCSSGGCGERVRARRHYHKVTSSG